MKIVAIGDLHIVDSNSKGWSILKKFLLSEDSQSADHIILLGDIFDLMVGNHFQYTVKYAYFFNAISSLINSGKHIHYLVGNHDFHLAHLFDEYLSVNKLEPKLFHYHTEAFDLDGKTYFGHGDELEYYNWKYQLYTKLIRSSFFRIIIDSVPYSLIQRIGNRSSKASRKRGAKKLKVVGEKTRSLRFIDACMNFLAQSKYDNLICGHSHFEADVRENNKHYINPGNSSRSQKYAVVEDGIARMATLQ